MTKQQAKERAAARRQVAGQGTLDRFLSPSQDKQVQKQLARQHKCAAGAKSIKTLQQYKQGSKAAPPAGSKKQKQDAGAGQPQACVTRPVRQMKRLYPDDEHPIDISQSPEGKAKHEPLVIQDDDADFQPAKRARSRSAAAKAAELKSGKAKVGKGSSKAQDVSAVSLQSLSFTKENSKTSKDHARQPDVLCDKDEVTSAQPSCRTQSKSTYKGLY